MPVKREQGAVNLLAVCHDCEWKDATDEGEALAQEHAEAKGHFVSIEMEFAVIYDGRVE